MATGQLLASRKLPFYQLKLERLSNCGAIQTCSPFGKKSGQRALRRELDCPTLFEALHSRLAWPPEGSYLHSYPFLVAHVAALGPLDEGGFIVVAHLVYE